MPELPEVETVVNSIAPCIVGRTIRSAEFLSHFVTRGDFLSAAASLSGGRIEAIQRIGKHIVIQLDRGFLHVHLGMTGKLLWNAPRSPYTRAVLELENGCLTYDDIRQFGRVNYHHQLPKSVTGLGPDALGLEFEEFWHDLHTRRSPIKTLLLNQRFMSGIGNIYADETLFAARIHPSSRSERMSKGRAGRLFTEMRRILASAIECRGSSISDYVDSAGVRGSFQNLHQVYGKTGQPCPRCGTAIRRTVVAQRGTHYCPRCQRH